MTEKEWQEFYQEYHFFQQAAPQYLKVLKVNLLLEEIRTLREVNEKRESSN